MDIRDIYRTERTDLLQCVNTHALAGLLRNRILRPGYGAICSLAYILNLVVLPEVNAVYCRLRNEEDVIFNCRRTTWNQDRELNK
jgi:hypothetical protein